MTIEYMRIRHGCQKGDELSIDHKGRGRRTFGKKPATGDRPIIGIACARARNGKKLIPVWLYQKKRGDS